MGCIVLCRTFHTAPVQGQGLAPIVPHCSDSGPGPCPSTGHNQCDYTRRLISHLVVCFCEHPACVCAGNPLCRTICRTRYRCRVSLHCGSTCEASLRSCCCKCWDILGKYTARRASYKLKAFHYGCLTMVK